MKEYGKMTGVTGALSGVCTFGLSFVHILIVAKFDYMQAMAWFFVLSIICFIISSLVCLSMKELQQQSEEVKITSKEDMLAAFKNKNTYILLVPNFARGIAVGIMSVITVIAISQGLLNAETSTYVNIVTQVGSLIGNLLYAFSCKKLSSKNLLLISTLVVCILFPLCINFGTIAFWVLFFIMYIFRIIVDVAIPVMVTEIIPKEEIGAFTSIRMLVFTGAQAVATLIITPIVKSVGYLGLLIFAAVMQLICGVVYYVVAKKELQKQNFRKETVNCLDGKLGDCGLTLN